MNTSKMDTADPKTSNKMLVLVYLNWKDDEGNTFCKGIRWHMFGCTFCEEALSRWKDHAVNQHHGEGHSPSMVDGCTQWEGLDASGHSCRKDHTVDQEDREGHSTLMVDGCSQWEDLDASGLDSAEIKETSSVENRTQVLPYIKEQIMKENTSSDSRMMDSIVDGAKSNIQVTDPSEDNLKTDPSEDNLKTDPSEDNLKTDPSEDNLKTDPSEDNLKTTQESSITESKSNSQKPIVSEDGEGSEIQHNYLFILSPNSNSAVDSGVNSSSSVDSLVNSNSAVINGVSSNSAIDSRVKSNSDIGINSNLAIESGVNSNLAVDGGVNLSSSVDSSVKSNSAIDSGVNSNSAVEDRVNSNSALESGVSDLQPSSVSLNKVIFMYQCRNPNCSTSFHDKNELLRHERTCALGKKGGKQCSLCGKSYRNKGALIRHKKLFHRSHSKFLKQTNRNDKTASRVGRLSKSSKNSIEPNEIDSFENEEVEVQFPSFDDLVGAASDGGGDVLSDEKDGKKKVRCKTCSRLCLSRAHLKRHQLIHTDKQTCSICWREYKNMMGLIRHMIAVHPESGMNMADYVNNGVKIYGNKGDADVKCATCSRVCPSRAHLKRHMLIHTDQQTCRLCQKPYKNMMGLIRHMSLAHPDTEGNKTEIKHHDHKGTADNAEIENEGVQIKAEMMSENAEDLNLNYTDLVADLLKDEHDGTQNGHRSKRAKSKKSYFEKEFSEESSDFRNVKRQGNIDVSGEIDENQEWERGLVKQEIEKSKIETGISETENDSDYDVSEDIVKSSDLKDSQDDMGNGQYGGRIRQAKRCKKSYAEDLSEDASDDESYKEDALEMESGSDHEEEFGVEQEDSEEDVIVESDKNMTVIKIGKKSIFKCNECDKQFRWISHFRRHFVIHTGAVQCQTCQRSFINQHRLDQHIRKGHGETRKRVKKAKKVYECQICHKTFRWSSHLERHSERHADLTQQCGTCRQVYKDRSSLQRHIAKVHDGKGGGTHKYKCRSKFCAKSFYALSDRKEHEIKQHDGKAIECDICGQAFNNMSHRERHMKCHTEAKECEVCQKMCKNERSLLKHSKTHTEEKSMCQYCGKTFTDRSRLKSHETLHTNKEKFKCSHCNKCLANAADLRLHMQRHTGYLHLCKHCGKGEQTKLKLSEHEAIHTGVKAYKCPTCGECFRTTGQLFCHKLRHQDMRFSCDICNKKFRWKCDLFAHKDVHLDQRKHKCDVCDKRFNHMSNKFAHMKQVHLGIKRTGHGRGHRSTPKVPSQKSGAKDHNAVVSEALNKSSDIVSSVIRAPSLRLDPEGDISSVVRTPSHRLDSERDMSGVIRAPSNILEPERDISHGAMQVHPTPLAHQHPPSHPPAMTYHGIHGNSMMYPIVADRGLSLTYERGHQLLAAERGYPLTTEQGHSLAADQGHPLASERGQHPLAAEHGASQYRPVKPDGHFYSMADTLMHFSKDN